MLDVGATGHDEGDEDFPDTGQAVRRSGPGIATATWNYQYSGNHGTYHPNGGYNGSLTGPFDLPVPAVGGYPGPITSATAVNYRSTTVSGPDKKVVFYINRESQSISENRAVAQDVLNPAGNQLLQRTENSFALGNLVGNHLLERPVNNYQTSYHINQTQVLQRQYNAGGTDVFTTSYGNFDAYGRPTQIVKSSTLAP